MSNIKLGDYEHKIIAAIYDAALESTKWKAVLADICQFIDADEAFLLFFDAQHSQRNFTITAYNTRNYFPKDSIPLQIKKLKFLFSDSIASQILTSKNISERLGISYEEYFSAEEKNIEKSEYQMRVAIPLLTGDVIYSAIGFHCLADSADISKKALEFIERLSTHFVRALCIHNHLSILRAENDTLLEAIKRANLSVFLLDAQLHVVFVSPEAQEVLSSHPALSLRNRRLQAHIHKEQLRLETILTEFLDDGFRANYLATDGISMPLQHPDKTHPLRLVFLPIQQNCAGLQPGFPCLAVFVNNPERQRFISPAYLQMAYGLTITETQLAQLLLRGLGITEISAERNTSQETTRWQLKQIMGKTQTHSQPELIRLLAMLTNEFIHSANKVHS